MHDLPLVTTLALGLGFAFICGVIATRFRIPPIVGYLLAGIIIGPHTPGFTADMHIAEEFSEIGIVLLMFGVGLHFSVQDLLDVKKIAVPGAIGQITVATAMGAGLAYLWGWPVEQGLLFGLALSVASTVVLLRSFEEHNLVDTADGQITIGWLIVEDLVMVLALVLIPTLAAPGKDIPGISESSGSGPLWLQLTYALAKIAAFVALMMLVGKRFLPWILRHVAQIGSRELFTLAVFAVAVGVAFSSAKLFGISFALGAFFSGMMIRESDLSHEVAERALPFQDAFAVLFFVSVGMLFDPDILVEKPLIVLLVASVIMFGKSAAAFLIVLLFRYPLRTALLVSTGLAQIGEFSFILIALGKAVGLMPKEGGDLILAGAMISISLNPLMFASVKKIYIFVESHPALRSRFNMSPDGIGILDDDEQAGLRNSVIVVGHGRVGYFIREQLEKDGFDIIVIDRNRERVRSMRRKNQHAIFGDAGTVRVLRNAGAEKAIAIVLAVPDSYEAQRIIAAARRINPDIGIAVRAHNEREMEFFTQQGADIAVSGPQEIARRMAGYVSSLVTPEAPPPLVLK